ncbi:MAG: hypothetical protein H6526_05175 [Actinobacteria bacterium]|nr:hypothetical protein [Actinomycetota bacterium]MCB8997202.1 hypothetical protein [Actinomycetota bacterium]MCB9414658.1 hypothetical protein [Actinomycetota bacterium]
MRDPRALALALVPAAIVVVTSVFVQTFAGRYELLGAAYAPLLNAGVLLRAFGMFASVILVWGLLRSRGASRPVLALAILSGPVSYGITAALDALSYFPVGQAAYYGINPIAMATVAGQCAAAAVAEMAWRWWSRHRGREVGSPVTWRIAAAFGAGLLTVFFTVLYQGGVPFFYVYQRGYMFLFT